MVFEKCEISDNHNFEWGFIEAANNSDILLDKCKLLNNSSTADASAKDYTVPFFKVLDYHNVVEGSITVRDTEISGNKADCLTDCDYAVKLENYKPTNNAWLTRT